MLVMAANKLVSAATLEEQIENIRLTNGIAAAAYFIVGPSSIEALTALGHSDWHSRAEFDVDHLVRIGSITKAFTALATTILVERGELSFDTRVSAIVDPPPYLNPWAETHPVTTGQLLEHSAGLKDLSSREFAFDKPCTLQPPLAAAINYVMWQWHEVCCIRLRNGGLPGNLVPVPSPPRVRG